EVAAPSNPHRRQAPRRTPRVPSLKGFGHRPSAPADRSSTGRYPKPCTTADTSGLRLHRQLGAVSGLSENRSPPTGADPLRSFDLTSTGARTGHSSIAY